jgi:hypothetical protein
MKVEFTAQIPIEEAQLFILGLQSGEHAQAFVYRQEGRWQAKVYSEKTGLTWIQGDANFANNPEGIIQACIVYLEKPRT